MVELTVLAKVPGLTRVSVAARAALAKGATLRRYRAGEVLWTAGSEISHLLVVIDGEVRVTRPAGGRYHIVHTEGRGGSLGEVPFYCGGPAPATAVAAMPTLCLVFTRDAIARAIAADPSVAWVFLERLATRVRTLVGRLDRLPLQSTLTRLAGLILERFEQTGTADGVVNLEMTQTTLAAELGTVREVVVRALRSLRDRGIITRAGPRGVRVLNLTALRVVATTR